MNWLYFIRNNRHKDNGSLYLIEMYLRAFEYDEENELLVGEKIVSIDIMAMDKLLEIKKQDPDTAKLYFEKLNGNEYFIETHDLPAKDQDLYESKITLYLAATSFTLDEAWEWIRKIFILKDYPF